MFVKHRFVSDVADTAESDKVQASDWNDVHVFAQGSLVPIAAVSFSYDAASNSVHNERISGRVVSMNIPGEGYDHPCDIFIAVGDIPIDEDSEIHLVPVLSVGGQPSGDVFVANWSPGDVRISIEGSNAAGNISQFSSSGWVSLVVYAEIRQRQVES